MEERKDCPMKKADSTCSPCGGFCAAVDDSFCFCLRKAYEIGKDNAFQKASTYYTGAAYLYGGKKE